MTALVVDVFVPDWNGHASRFRNRFADATASVAEIIVPCLTSTPTGFQNRKRERIVLTTPEQRVLKTFREFLVTPGQMLCFYGPNLQKYKDALHQLTEKEFLIKEQFKGGYSLTHAGFAAMKQCA